MSITNHPSFIVLICDGKEKIQFSRGYLAAENFSKRFQEAKVNSATLQTRVNKLISKDKTLSQIFTRKGFKDTIASHKLLQAHIAHVHHVQIERKILTQKQKEDFKILEVGTYALNHLMMFNKIEDQEPNRDFLKAILETLLLCTYGFLKRWRSKAIDKTLLGFLKRTKISNDLPIIVRILGVLFNLYPTNFEAIVKRNNGEKDLSTACGKLLAVSEQNDAYFRLSVRVLSDCVTSIRRRKLVNFACSNFPLKITRIMCLRLVEYFGSSPKDLDHFVIAEVTCADIMNCVAKIFSGVLSRSKKKGGEYASWFRDLTRDVFAKCRKYKIEPVASVLIAQLLEYALDPYYGDMEHEISTLLAVIEHREDVSDEYYLPFFTNVIGRLEADTQRDVLGKIFAHFEDVVGKRLYVSMELAYFMFRNVRLVQMYGMSTQLVRLVKESDPMSVAVTRVLVGITRMLGVQNLVDEKKGGGGGNVTKLQLFEIKGDSCWMCGGRQKLFTCSRCKVATYCSRVCQKNEWAEHKKYCNTVRGEKK